MPRSRPKRKQNVRKARSELYRALILEAAERTFAEKGVEETKMEEIARESGLSLGTLYSVFAGKAALVREIHDVRLEEVLTLTSDVARELSSPVDRLLAGVRAYVEFFVVHPDYLRMHLAEGYAWGLGLIRSTGGRAAAWTEGVARQTAVFARGIDEGVFQPGDPALMARMMIAIQQVQLADWVEGGMQRHPDELIADMQEQVRRSFCVNSEALRAHPVAPKTQRRTTLGRKDA
jgi:TetR/AcrR family transcriptional regulator